MDYGYVTKIPICIAVYRQNPDQRQIPEAVVLFQMIDNVEGQSHSITETPLKNGLTLRSARMKRGYLQVNPTRRDSFSDDHIQVRFQTTS
jgi:hypothetical protein